MILCCSVRTIVATITMVCVESIRRSWRYLVASTAGAAGNLVLSRRSRASGARV